MAELIYTCPQCRQVVTYNEQDDVFVVVSNHLLQCPGKPPTPGYKRITEIVPPEIMKGNLIAIDDILEKEVLVTGMDWHSSSFKEDEEYLSLTVTVDGEEKILNTGAGQVVAVFRSVNPENLPVYCSFEKVQLPTGRRVFKVK